jgi:hypothetical protein
VALIQRQEKGANRAISKVAYFKNPERKMGTRPYFRAVKIGSVPIFEKADFCLMQVPV